MGISRGKELELKVNKKLGYPTDGFKDSELSFRKVILFALLSSCQDFLKCIAFIALPLLPSLSTVRIPDDSVSQFPQPWHQAGDETALEA